MIGEQWRDVPGWLGLYQVSTRGRVRSLPRLVRNHRGIYLYRGKIKRPFKSKKPPDTATATRGYGPRVSMTDRDRRTTAYVHELMREAFGK